MRKKKEKDEELKQRVLSDTQFADFSGNDFNRNLPIYSQILSAQDNFASRHYEVLSDNSHQNNSENSCIFEGEYKIIRPQPCYPIQAQYCNPNYLFECNNMNAGYSGNSEQINNCEGLENIWAFLGDLVYAKHSN